MPDSSRVKQEFYCPSGLKTEEGLQSLHQPLEAPIQHIDCIHSFGICKNFYRLNNWKCISACICYSYRALSSCTFLGSSSFSFISRLLVLRAAAQQNKLQRPDHRHRTKVRKAQCSTKPFPPGIISTPAPCSQRDSQSTVPLLLWEVMSLSLLHFIELSPLQTMLFVIITGPASLWE